MATTSLAEELAERLTGLGIGIRSHIMKSRDIRGDVRALGVAAGDTIFGIDRKVEPLIVNAMAALPSHLLPVMVVCEGLGVDGRQRFGPAEEPLKFRILIDPIDGTRSLMYDKRSAWFLAAVAPDVGEETSLSAAVASVMVELPTSKQGEADIFSYAAGSISASRQQLASGTTSALALNPSGETSLRNGFAQVSNFFPGTKVLASQLMEAIASATLGAVSVEEASIFDDQYISTGGQMVELMSGRDRFCCDLRPIFYQILHRRGQGQGAGLCCHPYDLAGLPIALASGVIITDGHGEALGPRFDVETPIHWCGYANKGLQTAIAPVIKHWIAKELMQ